MYTVLYGVRGALYGKLLGLLLIKDNFYKSAYLDIPKPSNMVSFIGFTIGSSIGFIIDLNIICALTLNN